MKTFTPALSRCGGRGDRRDAPRGRDAGRPAGGFTLVEVLAAMLLIGIVMPVVMQGVAAATRAGSASRHRTEAALLALSKLDELTVTHGWSNGSALAGDCGPDWPGYTWAATLAPWPGDVNAAGLQQLDVRVNWADGSVNVTTLVYTRPLPAS